MMLDDTVFEYLISFVDKHALPMRKAIGADHFGDNPVPERCTPKLQKFVDRIRKGYVIADDVLIHQFMGNIDLHRDVEFCDSTGTELILVVFLKVQNGWNHRAKFIYAEPGSSSLQVVEVSDGDAIFFNPREYHGLMSSEYNLSISFPLIKRMSPKEFILQFIKESGEEWLSPTAIGVAWGGSPFAGNASHYGSSWASKHCKELVKQGKLVRNAGGHYALARSGMES